MKFTVFANKLLFISICSTLITIPAIADSNVDSRKIAVMKEIYSFSVEDSDSDKENPLFTADLENVFQEDAICSKEEEGVCAIDYDVFIQGQDYDENENKIDISKLAEILAEVYRGNISQFYQNKAFFEIYKSEADIMFDGLIDVFDIVLKEKYTYNQDNTDLNVKKLSAMHLDHIEEVINLLYTIKIGLKNNINYDLAIEEVIFSIYKGGMN